MSGRELDQHVLAAGQADTRALRKAAVRCADHVAARHPHPLDADLPAARTELLELLDAIGYTTPRRTP